MLQHMTNVKTCRRPTPCYMINVLRNNENTYLNISNYVLCVPTIDYNMEEELAMFFYGTFQ